MLPRLHCLRLAYPSARRYLSATLAQPAPAPRFARSLTEDQKNRLEKWRMSLTPSYRYINADANPTGNGREYAVVDVRDSDFAVSPLGPPPSTFSLHLATSVHAALPDGRDPAMGGNIVGCLHYPSDEFMGNITEIVDRVKSGKLDWRNVRGPKAARRYIEARDMLLKEDAPKDQEVLVLREGFEGFHPRYRDDPVLVEKFNKFYHD
ncbi:hypothetical protein A1Q2_03690 [Trichosporon asahii var. asahii CBS 8904]|uniref:Uncharacterized protein n=1 Tax=Trichosporon asahii var. asahii (strain CBS 8904) TaxID=1220162 RepID=K1VDD2_TRIAC|nr:hypothetical protein A1Q2_03690 [Trichosporon asahii var. asahii CBS 8904]